MQAETPANAAAPNGKNWPYQERWHTPALWAARDRVKVEHSESSPEVEQIFHE